MQAYSIRLVSEDCLLIDWTQSEKIASQALTARIAAITHQLVEHHSAVVRNVTPAYLTLLIQFELLVITGDEIAVLVEQILTGLLTDGPQLRAPTLHEIPVFYDQSIAADLLSVCAARQVTKQQLIDAHTSVIYDVFAVGFLPGFAYLGYVPEQIASPRHTSFRGQVPAGSVGIADRQTAVYPSQSPGGWQIIGRSPKNLLKQHRSLLQIGDKVRFVALNQAEYWDLGGHS